MEPRISAVINTFNEEKNLPYALRSVQTWVDEVIVVDMYSTDRTAEIARQFGAKVWLHEGPGFTYPPREFAVAQASGEWVFILDADEVVPVALAEVLKRLATRKDIDVVLLPRMNYLLGAVLSHTGWGPKQDSQARFFRKGKIQASSIAHQDFLPSADAKVLRLPFKGDICIVHFNYVDAAQFIEKLNRYTTIEAKQAIDRGERASYLIVIKKAVREFLWRYFRARGCLDGWRGFYLSFFMAFYRLATYAKLKELEATGGRDKINEFYRQEANRILRQYGSDTPFSIAKQ